MRADAFLDAVREADAVLPDVAHQVIFVIFPNSPKSPGS